MFKKLLISLTILTGAFIGSYGIAHALTNTTGVTWNRNISGANQYPNPVTDQIGIGTSTSFSTDSLSVGGNAQIQSNGMTMASTSSHGNFFQAGYSIEYQHYAYVTANSQSEGGGDTLNVFDISSSTNPVLIKQISGGSDTSGAEEPAISGKFLFLVNFTSNSLAVFDISNPANPTNIALLIDNTNLDGAAAQKIVGNYDYIVNFHSDGSHPGFTVVDISDPYHPKVVNSIINSNITQPAYVLIRYPYAYETNESQVKPGLNIINISQPANPVYTDFFVPTGASSNILVGEDFYGRYLYIAGFGDNKIYVVDVSDPTNPKSVGAALTLPDTFPGTPIVVGNMLYVTFNGDGGSDACTVGCVGQFSLASTTNPTLVNTIITNALNTPDDIQSYGTNLYVTYHGDAGTHQGGLAIINTASLTTPSIETGSEIADHLDVTHDIYTNRLFAETGITTNAIMSLGPSSASNFISASSTATSTFANGLNLTGGCLEVNGSCFTGGGGAGTNYLTNSGANTYLNTGSNLEAPVLTATSTTGTSTVTHLTVSGNNPYALISTTSPIYGYFPEDLIDAGGSANDYFALNTFNNVSGSCAQSGFIANGDVPVLNNNFFSLMFTNTGWSDGGGGGCNLASPLHVNPYSAYLYEPTGDIDVVLGSSTNSTSFNVMGGGIGGPDTDFTVNQNGDVNVNGSASIIGNIFTITDDSDQLAFVCNSSDTCSTKNNTLDSGSGNMTILGVFRANGTATSTIAGPLSIGNPLVQPGAATSTESYFLAYATNTATVSGQVGDYFGFGTVRPSSVTGNSDLILGQGSGANGTVSGNGNTLFGSQVGPNQGNVNLSGSLNTFVGNASDDTNQTVSGGSNSCFGAQACGVTSGGSNTGIGTGALQKGTTESFDTAVGVNSLEWLGDNQSNNTAIGYDAGLGNGTTHTGGNESLFGIDSGAALSTGSNNTMLGSFTGSTTSTGANNIYIGYDIGDPNGTSSSNDLDIGNLLFGTGLTSQGTTTSSGSIGIGTTTPENTLSVQGGMSVYTSSATSTIFLDGSLGGGVITRDSAGSGCSELSSIAGVYTGKVIACPF